MKKIIGTKFASEKGTCFICGEPINMGQRVVYFTDYAEYLHVTHRHCIIKQILETLPELQLKNNQEAAETTAEAI